MPTHSHTPTRPLKSNRDHVHSFSTPDDHSACRLRPVLAHERAELQSVLHVSLTPSEAPLVPKTCPSTGNLKVGHATSRFTPLATPVRAVELDSQGSERQKSPDSGERRVEGLRAAVWRGRAELKELENIIQGRRRSLENYTPVKPAQPPACSTCPRPRRTVFSPPTTKEHTSVRTRENCQSDILQRSIQKNAFSAKSRTSLQRCVLRGWHRLAQSCKRFRKCTALLVRAVNEFALCTAFYFLYRHCLRMKRARSLNQSIGRRSLRFVVHTWIARVKSVQNSERCYSRVSKVWQQKAISAWRRRARMSTLADDFWQQLCHCCLKVLAASWHMYASRHRLCMQRANHHLQLVNLRCLKEVWYTWRSSVINLSQASLDFKKLSDALLLAQSRHVFSLCCRRAVAKRAISAIASRLLLSSMQDSLNTMLDRNQELQNRINTTKKTESSRCSPKGSSTVAYKLGGIAILKLSSCFASWVSFTASAKAGQETLHSALACRNWKLCRTMFGCWSDSVQRQELVLASNKDFASRRRPKRAFVLWFEYVSGAISRRWKGTRVQQAAFRRLLRNVLTTWITISVDKARTGSAVAAFTARWTAQRKFLVFHAWCDALLSREIRIPVAKLETATFRILSAAIAAWHQHRTFWSRAKRIVAVRACHRDMKTRSRVISAWWGVGCEKARRNNTLSKLRQQLQRSRSMVAVASWRSWARFQTRSARLVARFKAAREARWKAVAWDSWQGDVGRQPWTSGGDGGRQARRAAGALLKALRRWVRYARRRGLSRRLAVGAPGGGGVEGWALGGRVGRGRVARVVRGWKAGCEERRGLQRAVEVAARASEAVLAAKYLHAWGDARQGPHACRVEAAVRRALLRERKLWFDAWKLHLDRHVVPDTMALSKRRRMVSEGKQRCLHAWRVLLLQRRSRWTAFEQLRRRRRAALTAAHWAAWTAAARLTLPPPLVCPAPLGRMLLLPAAHEAGPRAGLRAARWSLAAWRQRSARSFFSRGALARAARGRRGRLLLQSVQRWAGQRVAGLHAREVCAALARKAAALAQSRALWAWRLHVDRERGGEEEGGAEARAGSSEEEREHGEEVRGRGLERGAVRGWAAEARQRGRAATLCENLGARRARQRGREGLQGWRQAVRGRRQREQLVGVAAGRGAGRRLKACVEGWSLRAASEKRLRRMAKTVALRARGSAQREAVGRWRRVAALRELRAVAWACQQDLHHRLLSYSFSLWQKLKYLIHCEKYLRDSRELCVLQEHFAGWKGLAAAHTRVQWTEFANRLLLVHTLEHQLERASSGAPRRRESGRPGGGGKGRRSTAGQLREGKRGLEAESVQAWRQEARARGQSRRLAVSVISRKAQRRVAGIAVVWWKTLSQQGRRLSAAHSRLHKALAALPRRRGAQALRCWHRAAEQRAHGRRVLAEASDKGAWRLCDAACAAWRAHVEAQLEVEHVAVSCLALKQKQEALLAWEALVAAHRSLAPAILDLNNASPAPLSSPTPSSSSRVLQALSPNLPRSAPRKAPRGHPASPTPRKPPVSGARRALASAAIDDGATPLRQAVQVQYPHDPLAESGGARGVVEAQLIIDASSSSVERAGLVEAELISAGELPATPSHGATHTVVEGFRNESSLVFLPVSPSRFAAAAPMEVDATPLRTTLSLQYPPTYTPAHPRSALKPAHGSAGRGVGLGCTPVFARSAVKVPSPCVEGREDSRGSSAGRCSLEPWEHAEADAAEAALAHHIERVLFGDAQSLAHHPPTPHQPPRARPSDPDSPLPPPPPLCPQDSPLRLVPCFKGSP